MIKFQGELSLKSKAFLFKKSIISNFIILTLPACFLLALAFLLANTIKNIIYICVALILFLFLLAFVYENSKEAKKEREVQTVCIIDNEIEMYKNGTIDYQRKQLDDVKEVLDMGEFYWISFYLPKSIYFICQKNLISEGSIEEFEKLFRDKIVKKY